MVPGLPLRAGGRGGGRRGPHARPACHPARGRPRTCLSATPAWRGLLVRFRFGEIAQTAPDVVRASAGVTLNGLVRWTINRGLAGLEAWAGTPGTVGGAVCGERSLSWPIDRRAGRGSRPPAAGGRRPPGLARRHGLRLRPEPRAGDKRGGAVGGVRRASCHGGRSAGGSTILAAVPETHAAARRAKRRLCVSQPGPPPLAAPGGRAVRGGRSRGRRRHEGARGRPGPRIAHARQFHRHRSGGPGAGRPEPHRAVPGGGRREVRGSVDPEVVFLGEFDAST